MQDTPDITGGRYENIFAWFITWKPANLFLYSERMQHRSATGAQLAGVQGSEPYPCPARCKNGIPI